MNNELEENMNHKGKKLLILAGLATATIHIINKIEYSHSLVKNVLACNQNNYYEWRFGKIRYTKKGSGTPLLLLHDLTIGSSSYEYHKLIDSLSKKHEVYAIDLLGYGLSDKPNITYTNYLFVQLVTDFIKNVIGRKTNIIACGDSAPIAIMLCHNDNEVINNLIAINPQSLFQLNQIPSKQTKILKMLIETPIIGTFIYNLHTNQRAFTKLFHEKLFYNPYNIKENDIISYQEAAHIQDFNSKYTYCSYVGRYTNANIIHALKEINNSIYIIAGDCKEDNHTIIENYEYYNNAIESVYINKTKQLPHLEKPNVVLRHIETFLN